MAFLNRGNNNKEALTSPPGQRARGNPRGGGARGFIGLTMWRQWQFFPVVALLGLALLLLHACFGASLERYRFGEWRGVCLLSVDPPLIGPARPLHIESNIVILASQGTESLQLHLDGLKGRLSFPRTPGVTVYVASRGGDVAQVVDGEQRVGAGDRVFVLRSASIVSETGCLPGQIRGVQKGQNYEGLLSRLGLPIGTSLLIFTIHRTILSVSIGEPIFNSPELKRIAYQTADHFAISTLYGLVCLELGAPPEGGGEGAATLLAYGQNAIIYKIISLEGQPGGVRAERLEAVHSNLSKGRHFAVGSVAAGLSFVEGTSLLPTDSLLVLMPHMFGQNIELLGLSNLVAKHVESLTSPDLRRLLRKLSKRNIDAIQVSLLDHAAPILQYCSLEDDVVFDSQRIIARDSSVQIQLSAPEYLHIACGPRCLVQLELQGSYLYPVVEEGGEEVYVHIPPRYGRPFLLVPPKGVQVQAGDEILLCRPPLTPSSSLGDVAFHCLGHDAIVRIPLKQRGRTDD